MQRQAFQASLPLMDGIHTQTMKIYNAGKIYSPITFRTFLGPDTKTSNFQHRRMMGFFMCFPSLDGTMIMEALLTTHKQTIFRCLWMASSQSATIGMSGVLLSFQVEAICQSYMSS